MLILRMPLAIGAQRWCSLFFSQHRRERGKTFGYQLPASLVQMAAVFGVAVAQFLACLVPILEGANLAIRIVGLDVSDVDYACDVVLFSEFADGAALKAYATHPEHLRVREELGDLRIGRFQVDYPIKETGA